FSVTKLEMARRSPSTFLKTLSEEAGGFGGPPKSMRWLNAANKLHESKDIKVAGDSLEEAFSKRKDTPANRKEVAKMIEALHIYEQSCKIKNLILVKSRESIHLTLSNKIELSGIIPLVHMSTVRGFAAYFIKDKF